MATWLICGGRKYGETKDELVRFMSVMHGQLHAVTDEESEKVRVIHGGASGADALAAGWATMVLGQDRVEAYPADWILHGRSAGPIRNQRMIDEGKPDLVIAFPGGAGTADMVRRARKAGIKVVEIGA